ncbi:hypothetical protein CTA1_11128 [Colletotrichum tanaceti]|uniref:Uncharacterized protein n=1 Tax=Colletotrichum tanaceti TaxID=1306861 RepID=A0A4U6XQN0_9PEZI|nr:hypothetical protein CTA1_11128 [Colletotrichum tanaceti]
MAGIIAPQAGSASASASAPSLEMVERGLLRKTSLYQSARGTVVMLVLLSTAASGTLAAALCKMRPGNLSHGAVVALAVALALSQSATLVAFVRHRCINPPPAPHAGRTVFSYYLAWIAMQAVAFVCVDHMWLRSWPEVLKNLCSMWMLLSVLTLGLWTIAIFSAASRRRGGHRYPEFRAAAAAAAAPRRTASAVAVRGATGDEAAAAAGIQPPPYAVVRDTEKGLA